MTSATAYDEAQARYEAARGSSVALDWVLRDAEVEHALRPPWTEGTAVSLIVQLHRSARGEPGLLRGSEQPLDGHVGLLAEALAAAGVPCRIEVRDPATGVLILHLATPQDADCLTRWVAAGLSPGRATARRLRCAFAAVNVHLRPHARDGRVEVGSLDPTDTAFFSRALGGVSRGDADGVADMDPDELEALAKDLAMRLHRTTNVRVVIDPEPGCGHQANRLRLGSVTEADAHLLAAYLESCAETKEDDR